jgi:hypothetical protein
MGHPDGRGWIEATTGILLPLCGIRMTAEEVMRLATSGKLVFVGVEADGNGLGTEG